MDDVTRSCIDALCYQSLLPVRDVCVSYTDTCRFVHTWMCSWLSCLYSYVAARPVLVSVGLGGGGLSSPKGAQVTLAGREDHLAPFSVRGTALDVGTFVIGDMGKDNSLRHHLRAVIDELGLRAPPSSPPHLPVPSRPPIQFLPPLSRCGGRNPPHSLVFL